MHETKSVSCDVLVVGSGAGGLAAATVAAAHGLEMIVAEKDRYVGGTTALSGGFMWIPNNPVSVATALRTASAARTYLQHEAGNHSTSSVRTLSSRMVLKLSRFSKQCARRSAVPLCA